MMADWMVQRQSPDLFWKRRPGADIRFTNEVVLSGEALERQMAHAVEAVLSLSPPWGQGCAAGSTRARTLHKDFVQRLASSRASPPLLALDVYNYATPLAVCDT